MWVLGVSCGSFAGRSGLRLFGTTVLMLAPTRHLFESTTYGVSAFAGQASTHRLHFSHRARVKGSSRGNSASVATAPNLSQGPCLGDITSELLP